MRVWSLRVLSWSVVTAWVVTSSAVTATVCRIFLHVESIGGVVGGVLRPLMYFLALPVILSEKLFGLGILPYHSADDIVTNLVAYTLETFVTVFTVALVAQLLWRFRLALLVAKRRSLSSDVPQTQENLDTR